MASSSGNLNGAPKMNWPPTDEEMKSSDGPRMNSLKSSRAYSVASPAADKSRRDPLRADNPGSIPTAGGEPLGARAAEEREYRRKSLMSVDVGKAPISLPLDKEGSPDAVTQTNTQANTVPARLNEYSGEGSSKVEPPQPELQREKSPSAPEVMPPNDIESSREDEKPAVSDPIPAATEPTENEMVVASSDTGNAVPEGTGLREKAEPATMSSEGTDVAPGTTELKDIAKPTTTSEINDPVSNPTTTEAQESAAKEPPSKERRGSLFGLMGKLKMGRNKG